MVQTEPLDRGEVHAEDGALVAQLFEQYHNAVFSYLVRLVGDWDSANDLTQDTFFELLRTSHRLDEVHNRRAWVYRIASHRAFNALKRRRRWAWLWLPGWMADSALGATADMTEQVDCRTDVDRALVELPPAYRAPLLLYSVHGLSVREVAEALQLTEEAVKKRLFRARKLFRDVYQRGGEL